MPDWRGDMRVEEDRQQIILSDVTEDTNISSAVFIGHIETKAIEDLLTIIPDDCPDPTFAALPGEADEVASVLSSVNPVLNDITLHDMLREQCELGKFQMSIGSMNVTDQQYLVDNTTPDEYLSIETPPQEENSDNNLLEKIHIESMEGYLNLDKIMVSAIQKGRHKGVDTNHLAKIWRIDEAIANKTIDITTQRSVRTDNPKLSRNYSTNDRMLRYKHLKEYFYMDTFFGTKKSKKSSRGNTCDQLFVTDKEYVHAVPMTK